MPSSGRQRDRVVLSARDLPFDKLNTNKGTGIGTFGMRDAKMIARAIRIAACCCIACQSSGYARMPYIGSHVVDSQGVALIEEWIRSLANIEQTPPLGSVNDQAIPSLVGSTEECCGWCEMHRGATDTREISNGGYGGNEGRFAGYSWAV